MIAQDGPATDLVPLFLGPTVRVDVLRFVWALEERGCSLRIGDDGALYVRPQALLSADDVEALRRDRAEVIEIVRYCDSPMTMEIM